MSSYHVKTLLFWASERNEPDEWNMDNLEVCIVLLFIDLQVALEQKYLPHYLLKNVNLFRDFTASEFEQLTECVENVLSNLPKALVDIEMEFVNKSQQMEQFNSRSKESSPEEPTVDQNTCRLYATFYSRWCACYDVMTQQLVEEVLNEEEANIERTSSFSNETKDLYKKSKMSANEMRRVFATIKSSLYTKHAMNMADAQRPIEQVILEDIAGQAKLLKFILAVPQDEQHTENSMKLLMSGVENGDTEANEVVGALMPDYSAFIGSMFK